jgi:hypothetical protein
MQVQDVQAAAMRRPTCRQEIARPVPWACGNRLFGLLVLLQMQLLHVMFGVALVLLLVLILVLVVFRVLLMLVLAPWGPAAAGRRRQWFP